MRASWGDSWGRYRKDCGEEKKWGRAKERFISWGSWWSKGNGGEDEELLVEVMVVTGSGEE